MKFNESQAKRQYAYTATVSILQFMLSDKLITKQEFNSSEAELREKYSPIILYKS